MKVLLVHDFSLFFFSDDESDLMKFPTSDQEFNRLMRQRIAEDKIDFKNAGGMRPIDYKFIDDKIYITYFCKDLEELKSHLVIIQEIGPDTWMEGDIAPLRDEDLNQFNEKYNLNLEYIELHPYIVSVIVDGRDMSYLLDQIK